LRKYIGKEQHGYWSLHINGTMQRYTNCHGIEPEVLFNSWVILGWWEVKCELDWYRMGKESKQLIEGPLEPIYA
jgi:hypothetical protein